MKRSIDNQQLRVWIIIIFSIHSTAPYSLMYVNTLVLLLTWFRREFLDACAILQMFSTEAFWLANGAFRRADNRCGIFWESSLDSQQSLGILPTHIRFTIKPSVKPFDVRLQASLQLQMMLICRLLRPPPRHAFARNLFYSNSYDWKLTRRWRVSAETRVDMKCVIYHFNKCFFIRVGGTCETGTRSTEESLTIFFCGAMTRQQVDSASHHNWILVHSRKLQSHADELGGNGPWAAVKIFM